MTFKVGDKVTIDPSYKERSGTHVWAAMSLDCLGIIEKVREDPYYDSYYVRWENDKFNNPQHNGVFGYKSDQIIPYVPQKPRRRL